jgi:7-keto-8-aminopelargonate synthetase-like enzyme
MDGDVSPLHALASLAHEFDSMLMVDVAHATGVLGERGRGSCEAGGIDGISNLIRVGTLSKALGSSGGFATGPRNVIDWIANRARPYVFSTAAPAACCAAGLAALEIVVREPERRRDLLARAACLREALAEDGWEVGPIPAAVSPSSVARAAVETDENSRTRRDIPEEATDMPASQIIPIMLGHPARATQVATSLCQQGIFAPAIRPPDILPKC